MHSIMQRVVFDGCTFNMASQVWTQDAKPLSQVCRTLHRDSDSNNDGDTDNDNDNHNDNDNDNDRIDKQEHQ